MFRGCGSTFKTPLEHISHDVIIYFQSSRFYLSSQSQHFPSVWVDLIPLRFKKKKVYLSVSVSTFFQCRCCDRQLMTSLFCLPYRQTERCGFSCLKVDFCPELPSLKWISSFMQLYRRIQSEGSLFRDVNSKNRWKHLSAVISCWEADRLQLKLCS